MNPRVSVLMPIHNGARYLEAALDSLLSQTFGDLEIIAVDDGSTDDTGGILNDFKQRDARVRAVRKENGGIVSALNLGLEHAVGEYIARMDADDEALPRRIEKQIAHMEANGDCVALGTWVMAVGPDSKPLGPMRPPTGHDEIVARLHSGDGAALVHPTTLFPARAIRSVGGYREKYRHVEDFDLYLRLAEIGKLANLSEVLLYYRQHDSSANSRHAMLQNALKQQCLAELKVGNSGSGVEAPSTGDAKQLVADRYAQWAFLAADYGNVSQARRYAWRSYTANPTRVSNLPRTLKLYKIARSRRQTGVDKKSKHGDGR